MREILFEVISTKKPFISFNPVSFDIIFYCIPFTLKRKIFQQKENLCKKLTKKTQKTLVLFFLIFYGNFHFSQESFTMKDNLFILDEKVFFEI